jgi:hypothetical protein
MRKKIKIPMAQEMLSMSLGPFPLVFLVVPTTVAVAVPVAPHSTPVSSCSQRQLGVLVVVVVGYWAPGSSFIAIIPLPGVPLPPRLFPLPHHSHPSLFPLSSCRLVRRCPFVVVRSLLAPSFLSCCSPFPPHEQLLAAVEWGGDGLSSSLSLPSPSSSLSGPCPRPGWGFWCGGGGPMVPLFVILSIVTFVCRLRCCQVVQTVI